MKKNFADEADCLAATVTMQREITSLEARLVESGQSPPQRPILASGNDDDVFRNYDQIAAHVSVLRTSLSLGKPPTPAAKPPVGAKAPGVKMNFTEKLLASKGVSSLAELESRKYAPPAGPTHNADGTKLTATERVLRAKGVTSLAELESKRTA